eukprot:3045733-Ditylum_brightwellii.AAC.1
MEQEMGMEPGQNISVYGGVAGDGAMAVEQFKAVPKYNALSDHQNVTVPFGLHLRRRKEEPRESRTMGVDEETGGYAHAYLEPWTFSLQGKCQPQDAPLPEPE